MDDKLKILLDSLTVPADVTNQQLEEVHQSRIATWSRLVPEESVNSLNDYLSSIHPDRIRQSRFIVQKYLDAHLSERSALVGAIQFLSESVFPELLLATRDPDENKAHWASVALSRLSLKADTLTWSLSFFFSLLEKPPPSTNPNDIADCFAYILRNPSVEQIARLKLLVSERPMGVMRCFLNWCHNDDAYEFLILNFPLVPDYSRMAIENRKTASVYLISQIKKYAADKSNEDLYENSIRALAILGDSSASKKLKSIQKKYSRI